VFNDFTGSNRGSLKSVGGDGVSFIFIGGNKGSFKSGSNILFGVGSPGFKLFLELFKFYSLLLPILGS
jgi:hypothetical protein